MMEKAGIFISMLLLASCAAESMQGHQEPPAVLAGMVLDINDKPIEHIKISLNQETGDPVESFTSSEGKFRHEIAMPKDEDAMTVIITLEDIDGEENGGLFDSHTESVLFERYDDKPTEMNLVFRLNHATASESSPQS